MSSLFILRQADALISEIVANEFDINNYRNLLTLMYRRGFPVAAARDGQVGIAVPGVTDDNIWSVILAVYLKYTLENDR